MTTGRVDSPKRLRKFRRAQARLLLVPVRRVAYLLSFFLPLIANSKALLVNYNGSYFFPLRFYHAASDFGQTRSARPITGS